MKKGGRQNLPPFQFSIMEKNKKLIKLDELKFDTIGDEYVYLHEILFSSSFGEIIRSGSEAPDISVLREYYKDLVAMNELDKKYEGSKRYWFTEQEKAIVDYINAQDTEERNRIYTKDLYKPMTKLIENIIFTYKLFRSDVEVKELQIDCMSFLITKIDKFNPKNGTQAFSYLGTIAKHYLMGEKRMQYKHVKSNVDIDETMEEASSRPENIVEHDDFEHEDINTVIFEGVISSLEEEIQKPKMLTNDRKVGEAIVWVFRNHELLKLYNKNTIYYLLKERTGLETKEITYSLSRFKSFYKVFKANFLNQNR
jgi:hypothetical protein